jgi:hypothetical protein
MAGENAMHQPTLAASLSPPRAEQPQLDPTGEGRRSLLKNVASRPQLLAAVQIITGQFIPGLLVFPA